MPFLENVTRGRNVPRERLLEVAEHYDHFGGVSPIKPGPRADRRPAPRARPAGNSVADLLGKPKLASVAGRYTRRDDRPGRQAGPGRRARGVQLVLELPPVPRGHRARPGRRRPECPHVDKIRVFYNHPEFIAANAARVAECTGRNSPLTADRQSTLPSPPIAFRSSMAQELRL